MRCFQKPSDPFIHPLVERTIVGLRRAFNKLLQGEFGLFHADWGLTLCTTQVQQIIALIACIIIVLGILLQVGQVHNPCDICFLQFSGWQESLYSEASGISRSCARRRSRWRSRAGRYWPTDWIVFRWS
jgi:hypothetical protein